MIICKSMNLDHLAERMGTGASIANAEKMRDVLVDYAEDNPGVTDTDDLDESQWLELLEKAVA